MRTICAIGRAISLLAFCQFPIAATAQTAADASSPPSRGLTSTSAPQVSVLSLPPSDDVVTVQAAFDLLDITEIDEEAETFEFSGVLTFEWMDKRQAFDPAEAGVDEIIYQGDYQFNELSPAWYPQAALVNASGLYEESGVVIRIRPDGHSTLVQMVNAVAKSSFDLRRTPFDTQRLEAVFEIFGFDSSEVAIKVEPISKPKHASGIKISQWTLNSVEVATREINAPHSGKSGVSSALILTVNMQRQSLFVVRLVMMPLTLIVVLSWSVFWMDRSSLGDRINVSFVGILTAAAYQIVVGDIMPHISYATLLSGFLDISFWVMCAAVVINLVVGAADKRGNFQQGDQIDRRCRLIFPLVYFGLLLGVAAIAFLY